MKKRILSVICLVLCLSLLCGCSVDTVAEGLHNWAEGFDGFTIPYAPGFMPPTEPEGTAPTGTVPSQPTQPVETVPVATEPVDIPEPTEPTEPEDLNYTHYSDMVYTRPDMDAIEASVSKCLEIAAGGDADATMEAVYEFDTLYGDFITNYFLSNIRYSADLTDTVWEEEYNYCSELIPSAEAELDRLYYGLADTPVREALEETDYFGENFFDDYDGESIWDDTFTALSEREVELESRYYALSEEALEIGRYSEEFYMKMAPEMADLLAELVLVRQDMAAHLGYNNYLEFSYDYYHIRDYDPYEAIAYLQVVGQELSNLYRKVNNSSIWWQNMTYCNSQDCYEYLQTLTDALGGDLQEAFAHMEEYGLSNTDYSDNKYNSSFEMYLYSYDSPFMFVNPTGYSTDKLTFAHEFGHFTNDFVCYGSNAGTDVAEIHSQALEFLSLCYGEGKDDKKLAKIKMSDTLSVYVEQSAFALFEHELYQMDSSQISGDAIMELFDKIGNDFGFDSWGFSPSDFVTVPHFYTEPLYIVSYVVSNDVAFQIYQKELESPGAGLEIYKECIYSEESLIKAFAQEYGLDNPLDPGRLVTVRKTLQEILGL